MKVLEEIGHASSPRRAGCVCYSGQANTKRFGGWLLCKSNCKKNDSLNNKSNHTIAHNG
ncbi:MAG: hypothetical protein ACI4DT_03860 [Chordicoccus sp.]|jgi:hypothetical protein